MKAIQAYIEKADLEKYMVLATVLAYTIMLNMNVENMATTLTNLMAAVFQKLRG